LCRPEKQRQVTSTAVRRNFLDAELNSPDPRVVGYFNILITTA
jgi:hypothetical protein